MTDISSDPFPKPYLIFMICAFTSDGRKVLLPDYAGNNPEDVVTKVMNKAWSEGYRGDFQSRIDDLNWRIVAIDVGKFGFQSGSI